jgi:predicted RNA-binding Zn-ribbon protein involved in translation (DUF1610 family)
MGKKKYDPLWELVDEKVALQGQEHELRVACPHCHVLVGVHTCAQAGECFACGLCGGVSRVVKEADGVSLASV